MELLINEASRRITYRDVLVRILVSLPVAHYVLAINEPEPIFEFIQLPGYWQLLFFNWLIVFIVFTVVNRITCFLDVKYPWSGKTTNRILFQIGLGIILPSMLVFVLAALFFKINGVDIFETGYLKLEWWFSILFIIILNSYYVIYYFVYLFFLVRKEERSVVIEATEKSIPNTWVLTHGLKSFIVDEGKIAYFFCVNKICFAVTFDNQEYLIEKTLTELRQGVDSQQFFGVNRYYIVNRAAITVSKPAKSNRLEIELTVPVRDEEGLFVSQRNTSEFKDWWGDR